MSRNVSDRAPRFEDRPGREARPFTAGVEDPFSELKAVLLRRTAALFAEITESPVDRIRTQVHELPADSFAVGGIPIAESGVQAPFVTLDLLEGRPLTQHAALVERMSALDIENQSPFGNAAAIYTRDGAAAQRFAERASAGMIGVNVGVPVPREPFGFGGWNDSRFGVGDITGRSSLEFWTQSKKVTTRW